MTPTEQDKELRDILSKVLLDGQNQIHDLKDGKATPEQITERMFASLDYWQPKLQQLITADRKRVELEARIEENESWYALGRMIDPREFVAEIGGLELKLQEEV